MTAPLWLSAAWAWLKRNWKWLLVPVGALLWLLGRSSSKKTVVVQSSEIEKHDELERTVEAQAEQQKEAIRAAEQQQLSGIESAHSAAVTEATQKTLNDASVAAGDSDKVNDLLHSVGKDMRK